MWRRWSCFLTKTDSVFKIKVEFCEGEGKVPIDNIAKKSSVQDERATCL